ncbi:nucleotidyltransferase family protein [Armatimonas sp.]|uniref:nucleotidyltransferase family protein n=1 Tax=Armatimonas sp. TaxID=1872638 RepID=UPI00374D3C26
MATAAPSQPNYEQRMSANLDWAMDEGGRFFEERSAVQMALRRITARLTELEIPYVVVGGMALFAHGFRRFTEDVDILVTAGGLERAHTALEGKGYRPPFEGSRHLRDTEQGIRIEFLVTGQFPGDGKPKPVAFPDPDAVALERAGIRFLNLPALVELKLASGMTGSGRLKDLADVQELIRALALPREFVEKLHEYVQAKFSELWEDVHADDVAE